MNYEDTDKPLTTRTRKTPLITAGEFFSKVMDSEAAHTSFGKLILGDEASAPQYCTFVITLLAFGTGDRFNANKFYLSKEMASAQMDAKWSPGPKYDEGVILKFPNAPNFGFGTARKNPLDIKPFIYEEAATVQAGINDYRMTQ
eukprot:TRINITY_DN9332_c0_g1_i15.p2 TRINITY_DN9332_c0_g1~~TRINITY_DN9332_c0_g1_i15.p2  ORF type:complete len:144 (+),score=15.41 TRINITY_DN9332_c0_g1_i15:152-583(+)